MEKVSNQQFAEILTDASMTIRSLGSENAALRTKLAALELHERTEKIAEAMHSKGLELDTSVEDLTTRLKTASEQGKLEAIEQAVEYVGPDMGAKIAALQSDATGASAGSSDFERFIVGGVG